MKPEHWLRTSMTGMPRTPRFRCRREAVPGKSTSGESEPRMTRSRSSAAIPAERSASRAASAPRSAPLAPASMKRRSRIPVRCSIHSSLVSISLVRSWLVTTRSGSWCPRPRMRAFTISSIVPPLSSQAQQSSAPRHARAEGQTADEVALPHPPGGEGVGERDRDAGRRDVTGRLGGRDDALARQAGGLRRLARDARVEVVDEEERDAVGGHAGVLEDLVRRAGERRARLRVHGAGVELVVVAAGAIGLAVHARGLVAAGGKLAPEALEAVGVAVQDGSEHARLARG